MKCSESWLREWVNFDLTREKLSDLLTMAGLEVESVEPVFDISITPNRGDCLSVRGIAREVSALTRAPLTPVAITAIPPASQETLPVTLSEGCPHYVGRIIRHVKADKPTPAWLQERLQQCGVNSISPIVDVTNYVMLELGQPMHAFDLGKIKQGIIVRQSKAGEKLTLLDGSEKVLDAETLVIADQEKVLAIAGVMGGMESGVTSLTHDIFLESAYFTPTTIARQRQYYLLNSDSAYRFERGVDPTIQREAIERATQLILEIVGGEAGAIIENTSEADLPAQRKIKFSPEKIEKILGFSIPTKEVEAIFKALNFKYDSLSGQVTTPSYRFDLSLPEDLVEEIARLYGYDKIPVQPIKADLRTHHAAENAPDTHPLRLALSHQGFHEIISYSFVDKKLQALLDPQEVPRELVNPITADMAVMRTNLWPGLVNTLLYNKSRQQQRIRLFEMGMCFLTQEQLKLGGLVTGLAQQEQWGVPAREVDFFDLKGAIEQLYPFTFKPDTHPALHPGQTAGIYAQNQQVGIIGALHPTVTQALDLPCKVFVFELDLTWLRTALQKLAHHHVQEISKFPEIRRDVAILVNQSIPSKDIQDTISKVTGDWLKDCFVFDVYAGKGVPPGLKSIALALILQHPTRTLVDDEVVALMDRVVQTLKDQLGAQLRS
ncbi:MAG: phenylalanine--tRNA ligase subunit beta [Gammaproteobacteria bacterium]|nr:MAG: phenylalanine--tRNA ligase subunit beta [Gammaproteobacteria bacterium]